MVKLDLQQLNWNNIISKNKNVNDNYNCLNNVLLNLLNKHIPEKRIKINVKPKKLWLTCGIKISSKNKRLLKIHVMYSKNKTLNNYYKAYDKILKKIIINSKKFESINRISKSTNKTKCMWQIIKERTNKIPKKSMQNIELKINNTLISRRVQS